MPDKRTATGSGTGLGGDDAAEQNREFGHEDQEFGGGTGDEEYGETPAKEDPSEVTPETGVPVMGEIAEPADAEDVAREHAALPGTEEEEEEEEE